MADIDNKVAVDSLISATVKYNNKNDDSRIYDISSDATISGNTITGFSNGYVYSVDESNSESGALADFSSYSKDNMNMNFYNVEDNARVAILEAVNAFMSNVEKAVKNNNINA